MKVRDFLLAGCGGGWRRAVRKRERESVQGERGESASLHFLRCSGFLRKLQAAKQHQGCSRRTGRVVLKVCELERKKLEHFLVKKMMQLEAFYLYLLGPDFKYRIGIQGTYTDLFLWNVLLNRRCVCVCACVRARMRGGSNRIV